jgi:5-methylcytosine-specific restriction endonuclease McrA
MAKTVEQLIMEYFEAHLREEVMQGDIAIWVMQEYKKEHGRECLDPWRSVRRLYQEGILIKVRKGVYKYIPELAERKELPDFPPEVKEEIFTRDGYKCVVCNRGKKDGVEIHADHIRAIDSGGTNTADNGQTLCSEHNLLKKNYSQTEAGKRYFIKLYHQAIAKGDKKMIKFCKQIFDAYNKHKINRHIVRPNKGSS